MLCFIRSSDSYGSYGWDLLTGSCGEDRASAVTFLLGFLGYDGGIPVG